MKKIASRSCRQVNVAPAETIKENSPSVPSVAHKTQEELQKPRAIPLRLSAEGEPYECQCEREAAEIVGMAEALAKCLSYQWKLQTLMK